MIDMRDEFKECQGFSREEVEGFIEMLLCIDWLFLTSLFLTKQSKFLCVQPLPSTNTIMYFLNV